VKLIIFDLDQTLVRPVNGVKVPNRLEQQEIISGVIERCEELRANGVLLAVASNQGGVAFGLSTLEESRERVEHAAKLIGAAKWIISLHHDKGTRDVTHLHMPYCGIAATPYFRKPQPGMLLHLVYHFQVTALDTLFVGDQESDQQAAQNAGIPFAWAKDFFGWQP
jgi:D-glycero-D-manno-heptose 1,7-bisphosphate phosphatase